MDGSGVAYQTRTVKGATSAIVLVSPGTHTIIASYRAAPPSVTAITPASGPAAGGSTVTVIGTNLFPGAMVTFGGSNATALAANRYGTELTCSTPPHGAATVDVAITNPDGQYVVLSHGYIFLPPNFVPAVVPRPGDPSLQESTPAPLPPAPRPGGGS